MGDTDRERAAALVADAVAEGLVGLDEVDARLDRVWRARTAAELEAVAADLPPAWRDARGERDREASSRERARLELRGQLASYAGVMALLVLIWLVVGVTAGAWYPWPVWPALGWGIALLGQARRASGRPRAAGWGCGVR